jgi:hypothetical protein
LEPFPTIKAAARATDAIVFFGATGDLAYKQIFPALQGLIRDEGLDIPIIGVAKAGWSLDQLKARAKDSLCSQVVALGASSKSQQALGTGVMGRMIAVVVLALLMVPTFFVVIQKLFSRGGKEDGGRELTGTSATVVNTLLPH